MPSYAQVLETIFSYVDYSRTRQIPYNTETYNLDRMREFCARLGHPQLSYPTVHIAGSKGKGSTAAISAAILQAAGQRTGLYTSPHLHTVRERIRIDGALIARRRLMNLWAQMRPHVKALPGTTTFEILTALAFLDFAQTSIDWGVIEVGLGGRLDATNVVSPHACAITPLSYEHTDLLGPTLSQIAFEKAGIIKPGVPVVVSSQQPEALAVIERIAAEAGAPLWRVGIDWRWEIRAASAQGLRLDIHGPGCDLRDLWLPLAGRHQAENAAAAIALLHAANQQASLDLSETVIRRGLERTRWPGRLECISDRPHIVLDSAHNRHSAEILEAALEFYPHERLILLFGASLDKDISGMFEVLGPDAEEIIVTRSFHPRAADPVELAAVGRAVLPDRHIHLTVDAQAGLDLALALAQPSDLVLVAGSIFVVADVREQWARRHPEAFAADDWARSAEAIEGAFTPMLPSPAFGAAGKPSLK